MQKVMIGIFAHPDDEAFGPSGTLLKLKDEGYDIHLVLLTDGDAGENIDTVASLAETRLSEWQTSADIIGVSSSTALHYPDGALSADDTALEAEVKEVVDRIIDSHQEQVDVSFITFEPRGLTSHTDHIVASQLTTRIAPIVHASAIWYFCLDESQAPLDETRYYYPKARERDYITHRIDVTPFVEKKIRMMDAHVSQRNDAEAMKKLGLATECFHIESL